MTDPKQTATSARTQPPPGAGLKLGDVYYVLFRRKWLILALALAGLAGAVAYYVSQKPVYWSEAKLLVRYVIDTKQIGGGVDTQIRSPGEFSGASIISSEFEILTSLDLCREVAEMVGPAKILGGSSSTNESVAAAIAVRQGLTVDNPKFSNIIRVRVSHGDPETAKAILEKIIEVYFRRHVAVHRAASAYDEILERQSMDLLKRVRENEDELRKVKSSAGVISLEDAKKDYSEQMARLRQEIFDLQSQIVEQQILAAVAPVTNSLAKTNELAPVPEPLDKISEYRTLNVRMETLRNKEFELTSSFTEQNPLVIRLREQITETSRRIKELETENPKLASMLLPRTSGPTASGLPTDSRFEQARVPALRAKVSLLTNQLASVQAEAAKLDAVEGKILDLQRKLELDEKNYKHVAAGLEAARFDNILGAGKISNIQPIQQPSPPAIQMGKRAKIAGMMLVGGLAAGLGLAFVIELLLVRSVRRPKDIEPRFKVPLFMSIPKLGLNGHSNVLPLAVAAPEVPASRAASVGDLRQTWANDHPLRPFIDGLRDRTLIHFDGDPHKPKLIGITSCSQGVGVTSLAAGLAGALSETGEGNVLLVNLNFDDQAVHPFYRGELACGLTEALELDKRSNGMVLQNLYVASAGNPADAETRNLSKQLARVVPKLRVSDYDYIVFDLPPTNPTSMTARLAGLMDLVMLVVESEKDSQDSVAQATQMLSRSRARVSAVLNKVRDPVPGWLQQKEA
jgi:polysaccharide biosynthesis transport protein